MILLEQDMKKGLSGIIMGADGGFKKCL